MNSSIPPSSRVESVPYRAVRGRAHTRRRLACRRCWPRITRVLRAGSTFPALWTSRNHFLRCLVTLGEDGLEEFLSFRGEFHPVFVSVALNGGQKIVEVSVRPWPKRFGYTIHDVRDWFLIRLYARKAEAAPAFVTEIYLQAQRPLDGDLPVAERFVRKDLRLLGLLEG